MLFTSLFKLLRFNPNRSIVKQCHSIFGLKNIIYQDKLEKVSLLPVTSDKQELAIELIKQYYLTEHVMVRDRGINLLDDRAMDEYLFNLLKQERTESVQSDGTIFTKPSCEPPQKYLLSHKIAHRSLSISLGAMIPQRTYRHLKLISNNTPVSAAGGNSLYAKTREGTIAGLCVNFASSPVDPRNLRNYAFYRQDPNTKDFLYFIAKLQETPNLWTIYKEPKIYEIKMLTVLPEFRRQGLATMLVEKSQVQAQDQGYKIIRMDCVNPHDYKVAERCKLKCLTKFPLHKLRGTNAPFIRRTSEYNRYVRVYVNANPQLDPTDKDSKDQLKDFENIFE